MIQLCLVQPDWLRVRQSVWCIVNPVKKRTIQPRSRVPSPENRQVYRVFRRNGVRYSETYLYMQIYAMAAGVDWAIRPRHFLNQDQRNYNLWWIEMVLLFLKAFASRYTLLETLILNTVCLYKNSTHFSRWPSRSIGWHVISVAVLTEILLRFPPKNIYLNYHKIHIYIGWKYPKNNNLILKSNFTAYNHCPWLWRR